MQKNSFLFSVAFASINSKTFVKIHFYPNPIPQTHIYILLGIFLKIICKSSCKILLILFWSWEEGVPSEFFPVLCNDLNSSVIYKSCLYHDFCCRIYGVAATFQAMKGR